MQHRRQLAPGYLSSAYAESLAEFGRPRELAKCGGWILERKIPGTDLHDAMGCYPLFACREWKNLQEDCEALSREVVALSVVTDPFGNYDQSVLGNVFKDVVRPFKSHFVADLRQSRDSLVSKHHRYYARRALNNVVVEICKRPDEIFEDWMALYSCLAQRHHLKGMKAFSRASFAKQLRVPGITILRALENRTTIGAHLWFTHGDVALSHLAATNARGYELMASYALYWSALAYFAERVRWIDWGAGAGLDGNEADGLTEFKRGWANETRMTFFCGRIFDVSAYQRLCQNNPATRSGYFPAYRAGEFD